MPKGVGLKGHAGEEMFWQEIKGLVLVAQDVFDIWES